MIAQARTNRRMALHTLGGEVRDAILARRFLLLLGTAFAGSFLLTWLLSVPLQMTEPLPGATPVASPAAVAASYAVLLGLLCLYFSLLPDGRTVEGNWDHVCAWLRTVDLTLVGFLGIWLAPGSGLPFSSVLALTALACSYAAALCGTHALLCVLRGHSSGVVRAVLAVLLALSITALLWTKAPLHALQSRGERGVALYNAGTQTVACLSPVMGLTAYWCANEAGFNLTKTTHTYQLWMGPSFISFPPLWPGRQGVSGVDQAPLGLGLVLSLLLWGTVLCVVGDTVRGTSMPSPPGGPGQEKASVPVPPKRCCEGGCGANEG